MAPMRVEAPPSDDEAAAWRVQAPAAASLGAITSSTLTLALAVDEGSTVRSWHCADGQPCFDSAQAAVAYLLPTSSTAREGGSFSTNEDFIATQLAG